jgi:flagellar protein FliS
MTPNNMHHNMAKYRENSITTARPEELILMLYNGLIRFILQAQKAIDDRNIPSAHENIIKAENIVRELQITLDKKYEIAESLMQIYEFMFRRLVAGNLQKSRSILDEVLGLAVQFRDT